jgi:hypothetical protein
MARKIIVLEKRGDGQWLVAYWLDVPVERRPFYALKAKPSAVAVGVVGGIETAEQAAITSGAVREVVDLFSMQGSPTPAQLKAGAELQWQRFQDVTNDDNPWVNYGSSFDGATWTMTGAS